MKKSAAEPYAVQDQVCGISQQGMGGENYPGKVRRRGAV
jgi:hypothetical protein